MRIFVNGYLLNLTWAKIDLHPNCSAKTGLRANLDSAKNYLIRLRKESGIPDLVHGMTYQVKSGSRCMRGSQAHKRPAAAADVDIVYEDAASLRAHDADARQWLVDDPTMFKTGLVRKFLSAKGLHLKLSVAESYLKRLKLPDDLFLAEPKRKSRSRIALGALGMPIKVSKSALSAFVDLTTVAADGDFEPYMPSLRAAFAAESCMTMPRLQLKLAEHGVKTSRAAMMLLLEVED